MIILTSILIDFNSYYIILESPIDRVPMISTILLDYMNLVSDNIKLKIYKMMILKWFRLGSNGTRSYGYK